MKYENKTKKELIEELKALRHRIDELELRKSSRKALGKTIQNTEEWYQRLLETMNEGFTIRDENTIFTYVNDKFCMMLGYERDELIGRHIKEFVDEFDLPILKEQLKKRKKGERGAYELTWTKKDGKKIHTIMSAAPLFDNQGAFKGGFGAMTDITSLKLAEKKLIIYQEQLRSLASELSLAEERERRRIAGELHDHIGQTLAITKIKLGSLRESAVSPDLVKDLDEVRGLIEQTIHDTRSLTMELSPPILYELGFEAAVEWLTEQMQQQHTIVTQFNNDPQQKPLDDDVRVLLFKVVRELLLNIAKHAQASSAKISLNRDGNRICITVEDDGIGFDTVNDRAPMGKKGGFGLFSIRERLDHLGGDFKIESLPGKGTRVIILAPLGMQRETKEEELS